MVAVVALGVQQLSAAAVRARQDWTGDVAVAVLDRAVDGGDPVSAADVRTERRAAATLPDDALDEVPPEAVAVVRLPAGTVLTPSLLELHGRSATARALPVGRVAVVVRTGDLPRLATRGDRVDVASPTWDGPVATDAEVLRVDGDAVTLAVGEDDAAATAAASLSGPVALVVRP